MRSYSVGLHVALLAALLAGCAPSGHDDSADAPVQANLQAADAEVAEFLAGLVRAARDDVGNGELHGRLGMAYEVNGFADAAEASYRQAEALAATDARWPYHRAMLTAHRGDLDAALAHLDRALALDASYAPAWLWRGNWLLDLDRVDEAQEALTKAAELQAGTAARVGAARVQLRRRQATEALAALEAVAQEAPHPYVYKLIGQAHAQLGNTEAARAALQRVDAAEPLRWPDQRSDEKKTYEASLSARVTRARNGIRTGAAASVIADLEDARTRHPDHEGLLTTLSEAYRQTGQLEASIAVLTHGIAVNERYYAFHLNIADDYIRSGQGERAFKHLERAIELNPSVAWAHAQKGLLLLERGNVDEALAAFDLGLHHQPGDANVLYYAGMANASRARWDASIRLFAAAVQAQPTFTLAHVGHSRALIEVGRLAEASAAIDAAERLGTHAQEVAAARSALARRQAKSR